MVAPGKVFLLRAKRSFYSDTDAAAGAVAGAASGDAAAASAAASAVCIYYVVIGAPVSVIT